MEHTKTDILINVEHSVLGAVITDNDSFDLIDLKPHEFVSESHQIIFAEIVEMLGSGRSVDVITLAESLQSKAQLDRVGELKYIGSIVGSCHTSKNITRHAGIIRKAYQRRQIKGMSAELEQAADEGKEPEEIIELAESKLLSLVENNNDSTMAHLFDAVVESIELEDREEQGLMTGIRCLDLRFNGLKNSDLIILAARPAMGKAQPLTSSVLLSDGSWKKMGDLSVGDKIASVDGKDSYVNGVFPQGIRDIYSVRLTDGRIVEADEEHLWEVESCKWNKKKVLTTIQIKNLISKERFKGRIKLSGHIGCFGCNEDIGIDPWLLGFLIGDGCLSASGVRISNPELYIHKKVIESSGLNLIPASRNAVGCDFNITYLGRSQPHPIKEALKNLGLSGCLSFEKFIPDNVFLCDRDTRINVLIGLLESDGWVEKFNSVQFSSSSEKLADGVIKLVWSLGGNAHKRVKKNPAYSYKGEIKRGRDAFIVSIIMDNLIDYIGSPRLLKNIRPRNKKSSQTISSIDFNRKDYAQCISVSHSSNLYITDGYVVTHNTSLAMQIAEHIAIRHSVLVFSMEMPKRQLAKRMLNFHENRIGKSQAIAHSKSLKFHIDDKSAINLQHVRSQCRKVKRQHGLDFIVIDYLQLMQGKGDNRNQEIGSISRGLKSIAKEFDIPVLVLSQLNRKLEDRADKRPVMSDLRESGEIEQDADIVMFIYRDDVYDENSPDEGLAEIITRKYRNGSSGTDYTEFDGANTRFRDTKRRPENRVKNISRGFSINSVG